MGYSIPAGNEAPALLSGKPRPLGRGKRLIVTGIVIALGLALAIRIAASGAINWSVVSSF